MTSARTLGDRVLFTTLHGPILAEHRRPNQDMLESVWLYKTQPRRLVGCWLHSRDGFVSGIVEHRSGRGCWALNGKPLDAVVAYAAAVHG